MNLNSNSENKQLSSFEVIQKAILNTNKHFIGLVSNISFTLLLSICIFAALWIWYMRIFGPTHFMVSIFQLMMNTSLFIVILFMLSLYLFNRINSTPSYNLTFWRFTKEVTWPWLVEGLKATGIIVLAFLCLVIPGIIKNIHYCFFSFVVFFNKKYKENQIDALKHSKNLSKGLGFWIFGLCMILPSLINYIPTIISKIVFQQTNSFWIIYISLILCVYVSCLVLTYICSILFFMYAIKDQDQMIGTVKIDSI